MPEQRDQNDDGDWHPEHIQKNRTHKTSFGG